mmetsp:Transcript_33577/g.39112  ORF Transcript_33577/g.39112 Transcript_33577/m.39112 type:complete len:781 (-) Transcript_33577:2767-5109(-)
MAHLKQDSYVRMKPPENSQGASYSMDELRVRDAPYEVVLVKYNTFLDQFVTFLATVLSSTSVTCWVIILLAFLVIPAFILILFESNNSTLHIWLFTATGIVILSLFAGSIFVRCPSWETLQNVNNNFYEPTGESNTKYKPREIEDIYYSQGVWRTKSTNQIIKFRGVNLPAKTPAIGHSPEVFYSAKRNVSFIDAPFPLSTAHEHFHRLANYGLNLLRLTVTWEAVMHDAPGVIDVEYLKYLSSLLDIAAKYGLYVIIDPHQDVWSRFTGGDGAPWWTLDAAGFITDDDTLHETGCAFLDHLHEPTPKEQRPKMIWPTNYGKLATATMFTLFFAGDRYAPGINVDETYAQGEGDENKNISLQTFLQKYYLQFIDAVAESVKDKPNVIGFNTMNEPSNGYVGIKDLTARTVPMPYGFSKSYFDGMRLGNGETLSRQYFSTPFMYHSVRTINPGRLSAWKTPNHNIWEKVGVYTTENENTVLLKPDHFKMDGDDFIAEFMVPLFEKIQKIITWHNKKFVVYAEPFIDINDHKMFKAPITFDSDKYAWSPHWYDASTLMFRKYIHWLALDDEQELPVISVGKIQATFKRILGHLRETGNDKVHVVLGEVGVPFDMNRSNNYAASTMALERIMTAIEANDLDFTLWNYFPDNTIEEGDKWCGEDLSVRTKTENRALMSLIRPFAHKLGSHFDLLKQSFDPSKKLKKYELTVRFRIQGDDYEVKETSNNILIYLPHFHFSNPQIRVSAGTTRIMTFNQNLVWEGLPITPNFDSVDEFTLIIENGN